jgi:hypothetical protein
MTKKLILFPLITLMLVSAGCVKQSSPLAEQVPQEVQQPAQTQTQTQEPIKYQGEDGKTALELLKAKYNIQTQNFGAAGDFVSTINGVTPDSSHFWSFYVNGVQSNVGASQYITKNTDTIEWKLEAIK